MDAVLGVDHQLLLAVGLLGVLVNTGGAEALFGAGILGDGNFYMRYIILEREGKNNSQNIIHKNERKTRSNIVT